MCLRSCVGVVSGPSGWAEPCPGANGVAERTKAAQTEKEMRRDIYGVVLLPIPARHDLLVQHGIEPGIIFPSISSNHHATDFYYS